MEIEKVNKDKIRVTFNIDDLNEKNIDFHSFMSNSIESQKLFLDMLNEAKSKVGFVTDDYKVLIETTVSDNGTFTCNLTRLVPDVKKERFTKSNIHKKNIDSANTTVYAFNDFDDFTCFCNFLANNFKGDINYFSDNSKLFLYNSTYFLLLDNVYANLDLLKTFCAYISEFAYFVSNSNYFKDKLLEFGDTIIDKNAILIASNYCS